jgi:hypothetical protein
MPTTGPTLAGQVLYATGANVVGWNAITAGDSYSAGINISIDGSTQKTISLSNPVNITSPLVTIVAGTTKVVDIALNSTAGAVTGNTAGISCSNKYTTGGVETVGQSVAITPTSIELNKVAEGANPAYVTEITAAAVITPTLAIGTRGTANYTFPAAQPSVGEILVATAVNKLEWQTLGEATPVTPTVNTRQASITFNYGGSSPLECDLYHQTELNKIIRIKSGPVAINATSPGSVIVSGNVDYSAAVYFPSMSGTTQILGTIAVFEITAVQYTLTYIPCNLLLVAAATTFNIQIEMLNGDVFKASTTYNILSNSLGYYSNFIYR